MSENTLLQGDALTFVDRYRQALGADARPLNLLYLDPPYNVGSAFFARKGGAGKRFRDKQTGELAYQDSWGGIEGFLDMLEPRLAALREGMAARGAMWLHLDQRTVHDAKAVCDRVFGRGAFRGEIIWMPGNGARGQGVPATHQTLLIYSKEPGQGRGIRWNSKEPELREPYAATSLAMHFRHQDEAGRHYRERTIRGKTYRYYADEGRARGSVWSDIPAMVANTPLRKEGTGYPTQKPLALMRRIVLACTAPGDVVADPMCGSGSTLAAAAELGRTFAGNDAGDVAMRVASQRLQQWLPQGAVAADTNTPLTPQRMG